MKLPLLLQELSLTSSTAKTPVATASMLLSATGGCPALRRLKFCSRLPIDLKSVRTKGPGGQHAADHAVLSGCGVACLQPLPRRLASLHWTLPRTSSVAAAGSDVCWADSLRRMQQLTCSARTWPAWLRARRRASRAACSS